MNKYIFISSALLLLSTACVKEEEMDSSHTEPMKFDSFVEQGTKAVGSKLEDINSTMGVWGYKFKKGITPAGNDFIPIFQSQSDYTPQIVTFEDNSWVYAPLRYWDTSCDYHFYAVSPHGLDVSCTFKEGKIWIHEFRANNDLKKQVDILVAARQEISSPEQVKFAFKHVLSKVNFKLQYGNSSSNTNAEQPIQETMEVTKLTLKNVYSKGTSCITVTGGNVVGDGWALSVTEVPEYQDYTFDTPIPLTYKGEPKEGMMNLFLIPWSTTNVRLDVEYRIGKTSFVKKDISLPGSSWEPNVNYTYKIILDALKIELEYNVEKWTDFKIEIPPFS